MSTAIAERPLAPVTVTSEQMELVKRTVAKDATPDELNLYLYDCQRQGVHPLDKLIHFTKRAGKYTPVTSIDFMRIRAADTGEYAGSDAPLFAADDGVWSSLLIGTTPPVAAMVTVWRLVQGQRCKFEAVARWAEYKPDSNDFMWKKMPHTMLGKCAEALALRKGFPRQLAGLYAREEMAQADARQPERLTIEASKRIELPEGTCQVLKVTPRSAGKAELAEVTYIDHAGVEHTHNTTVDWKGSAAALFEQLAEEAVPVTIITKETPRSKKTVIAEVHRWKASEAIDVEPVNPNRPPVMTADEIVF